MSATPQPISSHLHALATTTIGGQSRYVSNDLRLTNSMWRKKESRFRHAVNTAISQLTELLKLSALHEEWSRWDTRELEQLERNFMVLKTNHLGSSAHSIDESMINLQELINQASFAVAFNRKHQALRQYAHSNQGRRVLGHIGLEFSSETDRWVATDKTLQKFIEIEVRIDGYYVDATPEPYETPKEAFREVLRLLHPNYPELLRQVHIHPLFLEHPDEAETRAVSILPCEPLSLYHFYLDVKIQGHQYDKSELAFRITEDEHFVFNVPALREFDSLDEALEELVPTHSLIQEFFSHPNYVAYDQVERSTLPGDISDDMKIQLHWDEGAGWCTVRTVETVYVFMVQFSCDEGFGFQFAPNGRHIVNESLATCLCMVTHISEIALLLQFQPDETKLGIRWFRFLATKGLVEVPDNCINPETGEIWYAPVWSQDRGVHDNEDLLYSDSWNGHTGVPAWSILTHMLDQVELAPTKEEFIGSAQMSIATRDDAGDLLPLLEWLERKELEELDASPDDRLFDGRLSFPDVGVLPTLSPASKGIVFETNGLLHHRHDPQSHWEFAYLQILAFKQISDNNAVYHAMNNGKAWADNPGARYLQGLAGFPCHPQGGGTAPMLDELEQLLIRSFNRANEKGDIDAFWHTCFDPADVCLEARLRRLTAYIGQEEDLFIPDYREDPDLFRDLGEALRVFRHIEFQRYMEERGQSFWDYSEVQRRDTFDQCPYWASQHFTFENVWAYLMNSEEFLRRGHLAPEGTEREKRIAKTRLREAIGWITTLDSKREKFVEALDLATADAEPQMARPLLAHLDLAGM